MNQALLILPDKRVAVCTRVVEIQNMFWIFFLCNAPHPLPLPPLSLLFIAAPVHQATHFYREGRYTSCSDCWQDFKTAIAAKMCNEEAEALVSRACRSRDGQAIS